jgi:hypothetical protein
MLTISKRVSIGTHRRDAAIRRHRYVSQEHHFPFYRWHWLFVAKMPCKIHFLDLKVGKEFQCPGKWEIATGSTW